VTSAPSKAELREAVELLCGFIEACGWREFYYSDPPYDDENKVRGSSATLRSWLASVLTEPEREQVRKVRDRLIAAESTVFLDFGDEIAALSAVVDGKEEGDGRT
jgi:hypothetical protein